MNRIIALGFFLTLLAGCHTSRSLNVESLESIQPLKETERLITTLASDEMQGRNVGTAGIEKAAVFIETYLREAGVLPFFDASFRDEFTSGSTLTNNIVGIIPGTDKSIGKEYILIGAHYDHLGMTDHSEDMVYNGANDNASGVTAVLQMAAAAAKSPPRRSIIIALFSAEEKGIEGSAHLAEKLEREGIKPLCVINMEMVGKTLTDQPGKVYMTGFKKSNMAQKLNDLAGDEFVRFLESETRYALFYRSDNFPFFKKMNIPSHTFSTFDFTNYQYYHQPEDEVDQLDLPNMNVIIQKMTFALLKLANEDDPGIQLNN